MIEEHTSAIKAKQLHEKVVKLHRDPQSPRLNHVIPHLCSWGPSMTLLIKLTMATAGCSGSISANRWHTFSVVVPARLATKPNILDQGGDTKGQTVGAKTKCFNENLQKDAIDLIMIRCHAWEHLVEHIMTQALTCSLCYQN